MKRLSLMLPFLLFACHPVPATASESCTAKYSRMYEADAKAIEDGKGGELGKKIAFHALARYYEDQWLICKQREENSADENLKHYGRDIGKTIRPSRESASWR